MCGMFCVTKCMVIYKIECYIACEEGCMLFITKKMEKGVYTLLHRMSNDTFLFGSENPKQRLLASAIIRIFKLKGLAWVLKWILFEMNKYFLPTSKKVLPTFQTFCQDGVHFAQTVVHFALFQNQARKRGVLGWGWGCFVFIHIPERV